MIKCIVSSTLDVIEVRREGDKRERARISKRW